MFKKTKQKKTIKFTTKTTKCATHPKQLNRKMNKWMDRQMEKGLSEFQQHRRPTSRDGQ